MSKSLALTTTDKEPILDPTIEEEFPPIDPKDIVADVPVGEYVEKVGDGNFPEIHEDIQSDVLGSFRDPNDGGHLCPPNYIPRPLFVYLLEAESPHWQQWDKVGVYLTENEAYTAGALEQQGRIRVTELKLLKYDLGR